MSSTTETTPRYLRAINEYTEGELLRELYERARRRQIGMCDFCGLRADEMASSRATP